MIDEYDVVRLLEPECSADVFLKDSTEHLNIKCKRTCTQSVAYVDLQCHEPYLSDDDNDISLKRRRTPLYSQSNWNTADVHVDLQCHEPYLSDYDISVKRRRTSLYSQSNWNTSDVQKNYFTQTSHISNDVNRILITNHNPMIEKVQHHGYIVVNHMCYIPLKISKMYTPFNLIDIYDNIEKIYNDSFFIVDSIDIYHVLCSFAYF